MKKARLALFLPALLACLLSAPNLRAQGSSTPQYYPLDIDANLGFWGVGADGSLRFSDHLGARAGIDYLYYNYSGTVKDINYDINLRMMYEPITLDLYPSARNSFHISLGVAFNQNRLGGSASGSVTINDIPYNDAALNLNISEQPVDPYVSLGGNFFYFDSARHWALGGEIGAMYIGTTRVSLTGSSNIPQDQLESERDQVANDLNKLKFLPIAKLKVTFSF